jgi:transposase
MDLLHERCAGLDVHQATVVACVRWVAGRAVQRELREFGTSTRELHELRDWLLGHGVTPVVMESTGVYWKPVWHVLAGSFALVLANATRVRNVPGRKSDANDAVWLADLLAHGLIPASFVPDTVVQTVRGLTRTRTQLVREHSRHVQRVHKVLQDANLKLATVLSDVLGRSGRAILNALVAGESEPARLAALVSTRVKASRAALLDALRGTVTDDHRFTLRLHLELMDRLMQAVAAVDARLSDALAAVSVVVERVTTIPGISTTTARTLLGEIGWDMTPFRTAGHLVSWAGLCPRLDESAGKHRSVRVRKGGRWLKTALVQAAWAAIKVKGSYLQAQFLRLKARRGPKKAIIAVAASMLTAAYHMLRNGTDYHDLGGTHFDQRAKHRVTAGLVRRLGQLGYTVALTPAA